MDPTFSELLLAVMLGDLHLVHLVFANEGGHFGEALTAGAADADQQHVAPELADHTHGAGHCAGNQGLPSVVTPV